MNLDFLDSIARVTAKPTYSGPISPKDAAKGMEFSSANAKALLVESHLLFDHGHWARAAALAILAIEEASKDSILRGLLTTKNFEKEWKSFRKHTKKNLTWILLPVILGGAKKVEDFTILFDRDSNHGKMIERFKQLALYTDAVGDIEWVNPLSVAEEGVAKILISFADVIVQSHSPMSLEELEIWAKHFQDKEGQSMAEMKQTMLAFYQEAKQKGLLPSDPNIEKIEAFLLQK